MKKTKNFFKWLLQQVNRDNLVGDIARHIKSDEDIDESMSFDEIVETIKGKTIGYFRIQSLDDWDKEGSVHPIFCLDLAFREFNLYLEKRELQKYILPSFDGYIYFLRDPKLGNEIKIGRARDIKHRVTSLNTGRPRDLEIIREVYSGDYKSLERKIHKYFKSKKIRREWFKIEKEELEYFLDNMYSLIDFE